MNGQIQIIPKFRIDDIVCMKDEFHFNPAYGVTSIGKIQAIHVYSKQGLFSDEDTRRRITYSISGFSLRPDEEELDFYIEDVANK